VIIEHRRHSLRNAIELSFQPIEARVETDHPRFCFGPVRFQFRSQDFFKVPDSRLVYEYSDKNRQYSVMELARTCVSVTRAHLRRP